MVAENRGRVRVTAIAALTCLAFGAGCSGGGSSTDSSSNGSLNAGSDPGPTLGADDTAVQTYGYGPKPAAGVTYQPDVVMVPTGAAAIRSATTDGLVWTLGRAAKGVGDLRGDRIVSPSVSRELAQHATRPLIIVPSIATASTMPRV